MPMQPPWMASGVLQVPILERTSRTRSGDRTRLRAVNAGRRLSALEGTLVAWLALLFLLPIAIAYWSRRRDGRTSWSLTGAAFGSVISPASLGLYGTFFLGPLFIVTGLAGLLLSLVHEGPGYYLCIWLGLTPARAVVSGSAHIPVEVANALVWAAVYGFVGLAVDRRRRPARPQQG
jgi:hypothetical protein